MKRSYSNALIKQIAIIIGLQFVVLSIELNAQRLDPPERDPEPPSEVDNIRVSQQKTFAVTQSAVTTLALTPPPAGSFNLYSDSLALVDFYNSTNGPQWTNTTKKWLVGNVSNWFGVTVSGGRVTRLLLPNNNLNGTIPASIGNLKSLTLLRLYLNNLSGGIPESITNLTLLTELLLYDNPLGGSIPTNIGNLKQLTKLYLYRNNLSGELPASIVQLTKLQILAFHENDLTGNMDWLGTLINLTEIYFWGNHNLSCIIPESIGNLTKLQQVYGYHTKIYGSIPNSLGTYCKALTLLYLHDNNLSGPLPASLGNLVNLTNFWIHYNYGIAGPVPSGIANWTKIKTLSIGDTGLSGPLPVNIGNLNAMTELYIENSGISADLPLSLQSVTSLRVLDMKKMNLVSVPGWISNFTKLDSMILNNNSLSAIPDFTNNSNKAKMNYRVENNALDFGDLESSFTAPGVFMYNKFKYSPQAEISSSQTFTWNILSSNSFSVITPGTYNQYQWQKINSEGWQDVANQTLAQFNFPMVMPSDSGKYRLKITNQWVTGLTLYSKPFTLKVNGDIPQPQVADLRICSKQPFKLVATGLPSGTIKWYASSNDTTSLYIGDTLSFQQGLTATTQYFVLQKINNIASQRKVVTVTIDSLPTVNVSAGVSICKHDSTTISVSGNASQYQWSQGLGAGTPKIVRPDSTTTYSVVGIGQNGCRDSAKVKVIVRALPSASITPDSTTICKGSFATLKALGGVSYKWDNGELIQSRKVHPSMDTIYTVLVTDSIGCIGTAKAIVSVDVNTLQPSVDFLFDDVDGKQVFTPILNQFKTGCNFSYNWNFGDTFTATSAAPSHDYELPGIYTVSLKITYTCGLCPYEIVKVKQITIKDNLCDDVYCSEGGVGIGSPDIAIGYKLSVSGKIMMEGGKITLPSEWPDYVFAKDYNLIKLPELKRYINSYSHLPNMPSAHEVKKQGIDVGEMSVLLLQKTEELTLYFIELNNRLNKLEITNQTKE